MSQWRNVLAWLALVALVNPAGVFANSGGGPSENIVPVSLTTEPVVSQEPQEVPQFPHGRQIIPGFPPGYEPPSEVLETSPNSSPEPVIESLEANQPSTDQPSLKQATQPVAKKPAQKTAQKSTAVKAANKSASASPKSAPPKTVTTKTTHQPKPLVHSPIPLLPQEPLPEAWTKPKPEPIAAKPASSDVSTAKTLPPVQGGVSLEAEKPLPSEATSSDSLKNAQLDTTPASDARGLVKSQPRTSASKSAQKPTTAKKPHTTPAKVATSRPSKTKPVVHFPQDLGTARTSGNTQTASIPAAKSHVKRRYPSPYMAYKAANAWQRNNQTEIVYRYNRGVDYARRDKVEQAIEEYRKAISLNPHFADAYVGLSSTHMKKHDWETVILEALKALEMKRGFMDPLNIVRAHYNLAAAYCVVDNYEKAKTHYRMVRKAHHPSAAPLSSYIKRTCKQ